MINNRAVLLREAGEQAVAIATTRQAVNLYRQLATSDPATFRDYLAMALGNLANMLSDAGRGRDALGVAQEATALYRELAADANQRPELSGDNPYHAPLAMSLNNLAVHLSGAGRADEALTATREASVLYRTLSRRNPQAHLGNLAGTLTNLGSDLAAAGNTQEALTATREAVDVTRRLAFGNRPVYLPQLAQAVHQLAVRLDEAGRASSALASAREAVRLFEELNQQDPDHYADALQRSRDFVAHLATAR
jgi:tetratricopeptide (TPR) repeat protein